MNINVESPCLTQNLSGHSKAIKSLRFLPNRKELVTCGDDTNVFLWTYSSNIKAYRWKGHGDTVTDLDVTTDGRLIASSSIDKMIRLWKPSLKGGFAEINGQSPAQTVQFSPDNRQILGGFNDKSMKLYDVSTRRFQLSLKGHNGWVTCARFSDGCVVSCARDKSVKIWDIGSKCCVKNISLPSANALKLSVHPSGKYIALALESGSVRIYDLRTYKIVQHYVLHDVATSVAWHPKGLHFVSAGVEGTLYVVDTLEGRPIYSLQGGHGAINCVDFSPDGDHFAHAGEDKLVMIWKSNMLMDENAPPSSASSFRSSSSSGFE